MCEVVVKELVAEGLAVGGIEVVWGAFDGEQFSGWEDVVVVIDLGYDLGGDVKANLFAIAAGEVEVGMPANGHRLGLFADVFGGNGGVDRITGQCDNDGHVGL